ncbi:hypothetical protein FM106_09365 [Brachybacterium faecium]|nr:hypothetical protein FM106_09365 [Brachybacterium faecium]
MYQPTSTKISSLTRSGCFIDCNLPVFFTMLKILLIASLMNVFYFSNFLENERGVSTFIIE